MCTKLENFDPNRFQLLVDSEKRHLALSTVPEVVLQLAWEPTKLFREVGQLLEQECPELLMNDTAAVAAVDDYLLERGVGQEVRQQALEERTAAFKRMQELYHETGLIVSDPERHTVHSLLTELPEVEI